MRAVAEHLPASSRYHISLLINYKTFLLPVCDEEPFKVRVQQQDHRGEAAQGSCYGFVLLPEKMILHLETKSTNIFYYDHQK